MQEVDENTRRKSEMGSSPKNETSFSHPHVASDPVSLFSSVDHKKEEILKNVHKAYCDLRSCQGHKKYANTP